MRTKEGNIHNRHRTGFSKQVEEVIKESDILLEILDARFMEKTRNPEIEKIARNLGKKIIYVLNKSDLVDVNLMRRNIDLGKLNPHLFFSSKSRRGSMNLKKVIKMIENGDYCIDVIHQSLAVQSALKKVDELILENHLKTCVADSIKKGESDEAIKEVMEVLKKK